MAAQSTPDVNLHEAAEPRFGLREKLLLSLLTLCGFLVVGQLYVTIPLSAEIAAGFAVSAQRAALTGSAFGFAYALGVLVFGPLSDRYGRRRLVLFSLVALAGASLLVASAQDFTLLLVARAAQGFVAAAFPPAALALIAEDMPPAQRAFGMSLMSFAFLGSAPLAQFFAAAMPFGLSGIMLLLVPAYLAAALALWLCMRTARPAAPVAARSFGSGLSMLLRDRGMLSAWAAALTVLFSFVAFHGGMQGLAAASGIDAQLLRVVGLPPLLFTFVAAMVTRRRGAVFTARCGLALAALALAIAAIGVPAALIAASAALSAGIALAVPGLIATVSGRASNANRGLALSLYTFFLFIGASFAPPVAQALAQFGILPLALLPAALLAIAAAGLGSRS